jgi:hypothetical protein
MSPFPALLAHPATRGIPDRMQAVLTGGGISILLSRASIIAIGSRRRLKRWVIGLAAVELVLDAATLGTSIRWWITSLRRHRRLPLQLATAATLLHAGRVLVFVLGRLRPLENFDVRPEHRADHDDHWTWGQVSFAAVMSILGVVGVFVVRNRARPRSNPG